MSMHNVDELMEMMTQPSQRLIDDVCKIEGDIMILGAGGKVGPSLAIMARRAFDKAGHAGKVIAVSLFDRSGGRERMEACGVQVIEADLFDPEQLADLPGCGNIIFMAGKKFGTTDNQSLTWAVNVLLPAKICERFPSSRFVVFSTGNVYGDVSALSGGSLEEDEPNPDGEYGQTCLGRERVFEHYAEKNGTESLLFRLTYAIEMRYGVLYDVARSVLDGSPVCLDRGVYSCIWQGDVCEYAIRSLLHVQNPPNKLNVTGPQCISTRQTALRFGRLFGKTPIFRGEETAGGIYGNASKICALMGYPHVALDDMMEWQANWIRSGGESIDAPTHFESVDGKY